MVQSQLHPGAKWLMRIRAYSSMLILFIILGFWGMAVIFVTFNLLASIIMVIAVIVLVVIIGEVYARMAYERWLYEFTADVLKIEHGIIWKTYKSIPYERIQNVDIRRGVIARIFGFSSVEIQTAGYSGGYGRNGMPSSEGHLPAVSAESAEEIREFVIKKIKGKKSGGL